MNVIANVKQKYASYQSLDAKDKKTFWKEALINNALYILLVIAIIYTYTQNHRFLAPSSIVNIISLSAANLPIACGIAGCIVLTGTDLSAGRVVGLTACISASLSSDSGCDSGSCSGRRYRWMGQRFLRCQIPAASIYCNSCNAADRIRFFAYVHHDQRQ